MQAEARRRWIAGAIAGAERLCLPLPWERGGRRARMLDRRRAAAAARARPPELTGVARSDRNGGDAARLEGARSGADAKSGLDDVLTD